MATSLVDSEKTHLELFTLIWLDAITDAKEIRLTQKKFRCIINHLIKFEEIQTCQNYLQKTSSKDRLILIVTGRFGSQIVPLIEQFRQILSIYVFCMDKQANEKWASQHPKVKGVFIQLDELIKQFDEDYQILKDLEEPLAIHYYKSNKIKPGLNSQFIYYQIFVEYLLEIPSIDCDQSELIELLRREYEKNKTELANLERFQNEYSSSQALSWYLSNSFFSKTLRGIFSKSNLSILFLFRSYLVDIGKQLKSCQSNEHLKVYRSAIISRDELRTFQEYINQFISIDSILCARTDCESALAGFQRFRNSSETYRVVFEIDAHSKSVSNKPFAVINHNGQPCVLFAMGSIFRIESTICDDQGLWTIEMSLCDDQEQDLNKVFQSMKTQLGQSEIPLQRLGQVLCKMGKYDLAERCFNRLLNELPSNHSARSSLYQNFIDLASLKEDFQMVVHWDEKLRAHQPQNNPQSSNVKSKWMQNAVTIAGGNGQGIELNQLSHPWGLWIDNDEQMIYITEWTNHRIVQWKFNATNGKIIAGKNEQLNKPTDLLVDRITNSLIICDHGNNRVMKYSRGNPSSIQTIISDVHCFGLAIDNQGEIYVSDWKNNEVRRWKIGETSGTIVAGGNGQGNRLDQLNCPTYLFVDEEYSIYISDCDNNRVVKWTKNAREGLLIAGGNGSGNSLSQLSDPQGLIVDQHRNVYIADCSNDRIVRWKSGSKQGEILLGGNGRGHSSNQFNTLRALSFDEHGYIYAVDSENHRIQKFIIDLN